MTPKQALFCREYLVDLNATQAAIRAGYSPKTAYSQGERLLRKVEAQELIQELMADRVASTTRSANEVLKRLWSIVDADLTVAFHPDGSPKNPTELPAALREALAGIKLGETFEIKTNCRLKALEMLAKHYGMFIERIETKITEAKVQITLPDNGRG